MISLKDIINHYSDELLQQYAKVLLPSHINALHAILRCRTPGSGQFHVKCTQCDHAHWHPMSCGHRSCPLCQNYEASQWLDRQQAKLLPVDYFMATFTLPYQLRSLAWHNQKLIYSMMFACASSTLKDFGLNPKYLGANLGMTAVLHTHSRALNYHPHLHVIIPGGGVDKLKQQWKKIKGKYLFNEFALANVFRARMLEALNQQGLPIPVSLPKDWVVDCRHVGKGLPALKYLSRYLYRGVISEKNIIAHKGGVVTFKYIDSDTKKTCFSHLKGADFLWHLLQHVLPKGFRRIRDYGFLHANAKKLLSLVQLVLCVVIQTAKVRPMPVFQCPICQSPMAIIGFRLPGSSG